MNSSASSLYDWYVEGNSRVGPHVCAMGVLPIPSTELNATEIVCSTITSESVTNFRKIFRDTVSRDLMNFV